MKRAGILVLVLAAAAVAYYVMHRGPAALVLTGIVTTNDVIVGPQISGQIAKLLVKEGDTVAANQLLAVIAPEELRSDIQFYTHPTAGASSQVQQAAAALRQEQKQTADKIRQAEATLAAVEAQEKEAEADAEKARLD